MGFHPANNEMPQTLTELETRLKTAFDEGYKAGIGQLIDDLDTENLVDELEHRGVRVRTVF